MNGNSRTWIFLIAAGLALAGCGGSSNSNPPASGVTLTPSGVQVAAGATQQMQATAGDGGKSFIWQVNGTTGGSSSTGTISSSGLYTAPALPPAGGKVTITATEQGGAGASGTATLSIGFSNASLKGNYVFALRGLNLGAAWSAIGEFSANGSGQLQNGLEDTNNATATLTKAAFGGSYLVNPDGSGTLTLGSVQLRLAMQADGGALLLSASNGMALTGSLSVQAASASSAAFAAPLVLDADGQARNQGYAQLALISSANGGTLAGYEDISGASPLIRTSWTGTYNFDGSNHGTFAINDSNGSHLFSFYAISANSFALLSDDPAVSATGKVQAQTIGSSPNTALNGAFVFWLNGHNLTQAYTQAGQFNPSGAGSLGNVIEDINTPGNVQSGLTTSGTYSLDVGVNGRGTLTLNNQGANAPPSYVFYMLSPQTAEVISTNSLYVASGRLVMQQAGIPLNNSLLNAAYSFHYTAQNGPADLSANLGTLSLDGNGNLSGNMLQNSNGTLSAVTSLSGTYSVNGSARGTATLISNGGSRAPFAIYPLSASRFVLISTDPANPDLGVAVSQY